MLSLPLLRDKPEFIVERLAVKHFDAKGVVDRILQLDEDRRKVQAELDQLLNQQNTIARQVGELYKTGKKAEGDDLKNKSAALKATSAELDRRLGELESAL
ncbi:MAG TPA: serine--tRNA ligase, partial [Bacteroidia bacterium]|nr:serine--tRNA ligase [Bacteroidia bacterium]